MLGSIPESRCKETLSAILAGVGDAIIVADKDKNILFWNEAATTLNGSGATEDHNWSHHYGLFRADGVTPYEENDLPLVKAINGVRTEKEVMFIKNEHLPHGVWVSVTAVPLSFGGIIIFRDITEAQKACHGLQQIIAGHEETLAATPTPPATPPAVVVKIEIPAAATVIQHELPNPDPRTP